MSSILTLTVNPTVDIATATKRVEPTRKIRCDTPRRDPGGGGINAARVIAELGGDVIAVFTCGGPVGGALEGYMEHAGLAVRPIPIREDTRISFTVAETSSGEEFRFVMPGPELMPAEWQACLNAVADPDVPPPAMVVASGSLPPGVPGDFYAQVASAARGRGIPCALDASGPALKAALDEGVYLVKPNLRELAEFAGTSLDSEADQDEAAMALVRSGSAKIVALTLGADGALLATNRGVTRVAPPSVEVRSAVGAGDSFLGGMCRQLVAGWSVEQAFLYGVAAGSAALLTTGTELCRREDVDRLYSELESRA